MEGQCPECGDTIKGRSDKKFCSDQCRNAYNNRLNSDRDNYMRKVNNILRKNRRILEKLNPNGKAKTSKKILLEQGFDFNYFTNFYKTKQGKVYYFCYEQGLLPLENNEFALVVKSDYVDKY